MFVELCSSGLARYGLDLGHLQQQSLGTRTYRVALFERDAGQRGYVYGERAFVELGQKAASQTEEDAYGYGKQRCRAYNNLACVGENPQQCTLVIILKPYGKEGFLGHFAFALAEQVAAQHGGERQCHEGRSKEGCDEGYAEGYEHASLHAAEEEERGEAYHDDERGIEYRHTHFARSVEHEFDNWHALCLGQFAILAYMLVHVLHIYYSIVDE